MWELWEGKKDKKLQGHTECKVPNQGVHEAHL